MPMYTRDVLKRKREEEAGQFVAFDYLLVINCHYTVVRGTINSLVPSEKQWN